MSPTQILAAGALVAGALLAVAQPGGERPLVAYPDGFANWRHLGSVVTVATDANRAEAPHGLVHHVYANEAAVAGLRTGTFSPGAVLVADWFVLKQKYPGGFDEAWRHRTDVMVKDARFAATGGWGYEQFDRDSRTRRNVGGGAGPSQCFACHTKVKARDYVFSRLRSPG